MEYDEDLVENVNFPLYRDALAAVLIDKLAQPAEKPKRRAKRRARAAKGAKGARAELDAAAGTEPEPEPKPQPGAEPGLRDCDPDRAAAAAATAVAPAAADNAGVDDNDDLAEFVDYLARETFDLLPAELKTLAHHVWIADAGLRAKYGSAEDDEDATKAPPAPLTAARVAALLPGLDPSPAADSLAAYGVTSEDGTSAADVVAPALTAYLASVTAQPPPPRSTRDQAEGCELCGRDWIPLSYHHLIPRFVHAKVVKRGWHRADELENVAWLCGACHRAVHRFADHETLARRYYTVPRLLEAPEIQRFAAWASRLRWKKR